MPIERKLEIGHLISQLAVRLDNRGYLHDVPDSALKQTLKLLKEQVERFRCEFEGGTLEAKAQSD